MIVLAVIPAPVMVIPTTKVPVTVPPTVKTVAAMLATLEVAVLNPDPENPGCVIRMLVPTTAIVGGVHAPVVG
jgi:hypothetical protein